MATELSREQLREMQLRILDVIDTFCAAHGLTYYLYAGSLLGAVRHQGFIPWDDDIDLMMSRADYERFCRTFRDSSGIHVLAPGTTPGFPYAGAKVCAPGTQVIERDAPDFPVGVNVDVFPIDDVSCGDLSWWLHTRLAHLLLLLQNSLLVEPDKPRPLFKATALRIVRWTFALLPEGTIARVRHRVARLAPSGSTMVGMLVTSVFWRVPRHRLSPPLPLPFEGVGRPAPRDSEHLLALVYGPSFLELPLAEDRVSPHMTVAFLEDG